MIEKTYKYTYPDFQDEYFKNSRDIRVEEVLEDGLAVDNYFLTHYMPTFYRYKSKWILPRHSSINCVAVLENDNIKIKELRDLKKGDLLVVGRSIDGSEGIFVDKNGFSGYKSTYNRLVETSFSKDYDFLFDLMKREKKEGYIVWVMGPSVVFDYDSRNALDKLVKAGFVDCVLAGNAMATHDLEGGYLGTSLGQNIYSQKNMPMGHYNHLDLLNEVRRAGSIESFMRQGNVKDGLMKSLVEREIPYVLAGSIRDDGPLPEVYASVEESLSEMKYYLEKASLVIGMASLLHTMAAADLCPTYRLKADASIEPVYMCAVDITENVINRIGAKREYCAYLPMVTNVQDFLVNCRRNLIDEKEGI